MRGKSLMIKLRKSIDETIETEWVNVKGPNRITYATFSIKKGSIVTVSLRGDGVWLKVPWRSYEPWVLLTASQYSLLT